MRILWRTLPRLALPAVTGLGLAYLATSFLPRPEPALRPPEELRALGLAYGEESPVRAVLERNVLRLESPPFAPPGSPLAPPTEPAAAAAALARPATQEQLRADLPQSNQTQTGQTQAAFAPPEPVLTPRQKASASLSGGPSVQGVVAAPTPQDAALDIEAFRLVGVVAGGARPVAMLQVDGAAVALHPGEQTHGWTLQEVRPDQVLLRRAERSQWLKLAPGRGTAP